MVGLLLSLGFSHLFQTPVVALTSDAAVSQGIGMIATFGLGGAITALIVFKLGAKAVRGMFGRLG